jgi:hypothetical protein
MAWFVSAMSLLNISDWFLNSFMVFGPLSWGALIFSDSTFTAVSKEKDRSTWNNTPLVLQTFQTYINTQIVHSPT